jgi:putative hydrolase of HD superfamily
MADQTPDHIVANLGYAPTPAVQGEWTVQKALAQLPGGAPQDDPTSPIPFFHMLERLKTTKREGWRRYGIERWV